MRIFLQMEPAKKINLAATSNLRFEISK